MPKVRLPYSLIICWRERNRYVPAVCAVAFSAVLIDLQFGLLLGMLSIASGPIDLASADIWVASRGVETFAYSQAIPRIWKSRLSQDADIECVEDYLTGFRSWNKPDGGIEQCVVIGTRLEDDSLGTPRNLTPSMRQRLTRPGTVVVYRTALAELGLKHGAGERAEVNGQRVEVVGVVPSAQGNAFTPILHCSLRTAYQLLAPAVQPTRQTSYVLARCRDPAVSTLVAEQFQQRYPDMEVLTSRQFSRRTQLYWLMKTKAGLALASSALLGLVVGAVIANQILYTATITASREYAVLRALGIRQGRLRGLVMAQAFWVALFGVVLSVPASCILAEAAMAFDITIALPVWLFIVTAALTMAVALAGGFAVLRSLRRADPAILLR